MGCLQTDQAVRFALKVNPRQSDVQVHNLLSNYKYPGPFDSGHPFQFEQSQFPCFVLRLSHDRLNWSMLLPWCLLHGFR